MGPFQEIGRRVLRSFPLPEADSDDILSDALTALYSGGLAQVCGGTIAELIAFLKAVVRNRAIDFLKARSKWAPTDSLAERRAEESVARPVSRDPFDIASGIADAPHRPGRVHDRSSKGLPGFDDGDRRCVLRRCGTARPRTLSR